jgi:hypothetical protein
MTLAAGTRLGPYEILAPLVAGILLPPLPAGAVHRGKPPAVGNTGRRPVVSGWGEGRLHRGFCEKASWSVDAPLTPSLSPRRGEREYGAP